MPSNTEMGHNHDENHVSKQSLSCSKSAAVSLLFCACALAKASSAVGATTKERLPSVAVK